MDIRNFIQYLKYEKRYSAHTIAAYENDLTQFSVYLQEIYSSGNLLTVNPGMVRSWLVYLMEQKIGSRSINRKLSSLKTFYRFQLKKGRLSQSPMSRVVAPKIPRHLPVFIHKNQVEMIWRNYQFREGFQGIRDRLIVELLYATGIRVSELVNMNDMDVDMYGNAVKVLGKGNKERIIPVSGRLKEIVKDYMAARSREFNKPSVSSLLVTDSGSKMYTRLVYSIVNRILKETTTAEKKSPHVLRHTFATHMLNNGAEINAIKELLGHASLAATQVYTHNTIEKLKDIYKKAHPKA